MRSSLVAGVLLAAMSAGGVSRAQLLDTAVYHGGPVLSPNIICLMWSKPSNAFTSTDVQNVQDYLLGMNEYFSNMALPSGATGGTEPVVRQYGVWGSYFSGTCTQDTSHSPTCGPNDPQCTPGYVNLTDRSPSSAVAQEIQTLTSVYPGGAYYPDNIVVVFTKGWPYDPKQANSFPQHWTIGAGKYIVIVPTDLANYTMVSHELIETATNPSNYTSWFTNQTGPNCSTSPHDTEVCDDAGNTNNVTLAVPAADGYGTGPNSAFYLSNAIDNVDGSSNTAVACPYDPGYMCAPIGNANQCVTGSGQVVDGNAFTNQTTTFPVTVVNTGTKINVLARTPGALVHLVSSDGGATYTTVTPAPAGSLSETPTAYSKDGTTIDMYGRGYDGALWHWTYNGSSWSSPVSLGGHLIGPPSAAYIRIGTWQADVVWLIQNDMSIYTVINGSWFYANMPAGVLAISPPQVFARNNTADIYFTGSDGKVHVDSGWSGSWQQLPGTGFGFVSATSAPGSQGRADVFAKTPMAQGGSSTWWVEYQGGAAVNNAQLSSLPSGAGPTAAVNFAGSSKVWLFFTYANQLYGATSDATGTSYTAWSQLTGTPAVTSPVTAFAPDSNTIVAYARRQSDGHLIQLRWVGTSLQPVQDLGVAIM